MQRWSGPVTLLSCDNLRNNGVSLLRGFSEFVDALDDIALAEWIKTSVSAPNSTVDRITPKFDPSLYQRLAEQGITGDLAPLSCEAFSQWVAKDNFIAGGPALEKVGVEFTQDVMPFEEAKIRILNASHSGIAWAGVLSAKQSIDESLHPIVCQWIRDYVEQDVSGVLPDGPIDLQRYCETTLSRFSNQRVRDTTQRVSSDSIAKLQQFILPTLKTRYQQQAVPRATWILVALLFRFIQRWTEGQRPFEYQDRVLASVPFAEIYQDHDPVAAFVHSRHLMGALAGRPATDEGLRQVLMTVDQGLKEIYPTS